jgi:hypothetical protein
MYPTNEPAITTHTYIAVPTTVWWRSSGEEARQEDEDRVVRALPADPEQRGEDCRAPDVAPEQHRQRDPRPGGGARLHAVLHRQADEERRERGQDADREEPAPGDVVGEGTERSGRRRWRTPSRSRTCSAKTHRSPAVGRDGVLRQQRRAHGPLRPEGEPLEDAPQQKLTEPGRVPRRPRSEDSVLAGGDAPSLWPVRGSTRPSCLTAAPAW